MLQRLVFKRVPAEEVLLKALLETDYTPKFWMYFR